MQYASNRLRSSSGSSFFLSAVNLLGRRTSPRADGVRPPRLLGRVLFEFAWISEAARQLGDPLRRRSRWLGTHYADVLHHLVINIVQQIHLDVVCLEGVGILAEADSSQPAGRDRLTT
jgi:hypothetical protein